LRHSPALTVPNTQYCSWCHRHNLRSVGEGVNNGRTNRDSFSPAVSGEAFVNLERLMEIGRYHISRSRPRSAIAKLANSAALSPMRAAP